MLSHVARDDTADGGKQSSSSSTTRANLHACVAGCHHIALKHACAARLQHQYRVHCIQFSFVAAISHHQAILVHRAPEQTGEGFGPRGSYTDVWGFATTLLHMATGQLPYSGLTLHQMLTAMIRERAPAVPDTLPPWLQQVLRQCLSFDVAARPTMQQLLQVSCFSHAATSCGARQEVNWGCLSPAHLQSCCHCPCFSCLTLDLYTVSDLMLPMHLQFCHSVITSSMGFAQRHQSVHHPPH